MMPTKTLLSYSPLFTTFYSASHISNTLSFPSLLLPFLKKNKNGPITHKDREKRKT